MDCAGAPSLETPLSSMVLNRCPFASTVCSLDCACSSLELGKPICPSQRLMFRRTGIEVPSAITVSCSCGFSGETAIVAKRIFSALVISVQPAGNTQRGATEALGAGSTAGGSPRAASLSLGALYDETV